MWVGYCVVIVAACIISSIYFYYTQRNIRCYYDDEIQSVSDILHV